MSCLTKKNTRTQNAKAFHLQVCHFRVVLRYIIHTSLNSLLLSIQSVLCVRNDLVFLEL